MNVRPRSDMATIVSAAAAVAGVVAAVILGILALQRNASAPPVVQAAVTVTTVEQGPAEQEFITTTHASAPTNTAAGAPPTTIPPEHRRTEYTTNRAVPTESARDGISRVGDARDLPDVIAAADETSVLLNRKSISVRGQLRITQSAPDPALQGIITTDLALDLTLADRDGDVRDIFTITSRGGSFTVDSSARQARERLRVALTERLKDQ